MNSNGVKNKDNYQEIGLNKECCSNSQKHNHNHEHCDCGSREHKHNHEHCDCGSYEHKHDHERCNCDSHSGSHNHEGCSCCAEKANVDINKLKKVSLKDIKIPLTKIAVSFIVATIAFILSSFAKSQTANIVSVVLYCIAYIVVGAEYVVKAVKGVIKRDIFNENMLMTVASLGALIIGEYTEGVAVMLLYCVGETLQDVAINKSKRNIAKLLDLKAEKCVKIDDGKYIEVNCDELCEGDVVIVRNGEKFPSDGIILKGQTMLDCSSMTGESMPVSVAENDNVLGGVVNIAQSVEVLITKKFKDTQASKILKLVQQAQESKPESHKLITKFAQIYTPVVFALAVIVAFLPPLFYDNYLYALSQIWLKKALVFLVVSCPCALVISIPLAFFAGIGQCCKKNVLVKGGNYLETLRKINVVCFDKTGTITKGCFEVEKVEAINGFSEKEVLDIAYVCESFSTHSIAKSIVNFIGKSEKVQGFECIEIAGCGVIAKGDKDEYIVGNAKLMQQHDIEVKPVNEYKTIVYVAKNKQCVGIIYLSDTVKDGVKKTIEVLKSNGIEVVMLTGDNRNTALEIAKQVNIDKVYAQLLPEDKYNIIQDYKAKGFSVMFVGDGLNDAPAIKCANIGVCVGGIGNDASVEASDIVLSTGEINALPDAFDIAKTVKNRAIQNIVLSLVVKVAIMVYSLMFNPIMWLAVVADVGVCIVAILNSVRKYR